MAALLELHFAEPILISRMVVGSNLKILAEAADGDVIDVWLGRDRVATGLKQPTGIWFYPPLLVVKGNYRFGVRAADHRDNPAVAMASQLVRRGVKFDGALVGEMALYCAELALTQARAAPDQ